MLRKLIWGSIILVSTLILIGWNLYQSTKSLEVTVIAPEQGVISEHIYASGQLEAINTYDIYSNKNAIVKELFIEKWDNVSKGEVLLTYDLEDAELQLQQEKNNLKILENEREKTSGKYFQDYRAASIAGQDIVLSDLEKLDTSIDLRISNQKLLLDSLRNKMKETSIIASESGIITVLNAELGQLIAQGTKVAIITDTNKLQIRAMLAELDASKIRLGMQAIITGDAFQQTYRGKVNRIAPIATPTVTSGSLIEVLIYVDSAVAIDLEDELKPGFNANMDFTISGSNHLLLPTTAILLEGDSSYVFKLVNNHAAKIEVTTGKDDGERIEVFTGITTSDQIIVNATQGLHEGTKVKYHD